MRLIKNLGISVGYLKPGDRFRNFQTNSTTIYTVIEVKEWESLCQGSDPGGVWDCVWDHHQIVYPVDNVE